MIPPSVQQKLLPRKYRVDPFRTALANAAAEPRTLEELEMERTQLDQKRCDTSKYTVPQRRAFDQEKRHLDCIIRDKKIANGSLLPVMGSRNGKMVTKWVPISERRRQTKRQRASSRRSTRRTLRILMNIENFALSAKRNPRQVERPRRQKPLEWLRAVWRRLTNQTQSVESLAPDPTRIARSDKQEAVGQSVVSG
jgi:hypothetical protein